MKWVTRTVWILIAAGIAVAIAMAYRPKPVRVETATASRGPMVVTIDSEGRTRVHDRYVISAPLMGQLARIEIQPGDEVHEGQVVANIVAAAAPLLDPRARDEAQTRVGSAEDARLQAQAAVERARVALELAQTEATRQRTLVEHDAAPRMALEQADAEVRARTAELASARFALLVAGHGVETARAVLGRLDPRTRTDGNPPVGVTVPASGRVLRVMQQSAGVVNVGTPLLEVGDPTALEIASDVLTADAVRVRPGARVTIQHWGGDAPLEGRVRLVEPSAFTKVSALGVEEQRVNVIIDLVSPVEQRRALGDGFRVDTEIETWSSEDVLRAPEGAVFREGERWAVFAIVGGHARKRVIGVGHRNGREVEVSSGLRAGERVVLHPSDAIHDGTAVEGG